MKGSVVIPVYNEEESVGVLHAELQRVLPTLSGEWEIVFVDDGSRDGTWKAIEALVTRSPATRAIRLHRNLGKSPAYVAGFQAARGSVIVTMDGDLQDDPRELPRLLRKMEETDADLVVGWKHGRERNEPHKKLPSAIYNAMKRRLFGLSLRDSNSGFRLMRREVAEGLQLYGDRYRFIPELAHLQGSKVIECRVRHRPRKFGTSKFGPTRFVTGALDMISLRFLTLYSRRPLHFFGGISLVPFVLGGGLELYVLAQKFLFESTFRTHMAAIVVGVLFLMVGVQLLSIGLVCEMLTAQRPVTVAQHIRERIGFDKG